MSFATRTSRSYSAIELSVPIMCLLMGTLCHSHLLPAAEESKQPILKIDHHPDRGTTSIDVATGALPPYARINIFRNNTPITEQNLIFCPKVASLTGNGTRCSINAPDSGTFYYALTTSDKYNRQNKSLLKTSLVGPLTEVCRTPPSPPAPYRQCRDGQAYLCWTPLPDPHVTKYRIYRCERNGRTAVGEIAVPEISGLLTYQIPFALAKDTDYLFTVTTVNSSDLESVDSAPVSFALLPDLEIASGTTIAQNPSFGTSRMFPLVGKPVKMSLTVHNRGLTAAQGVRVTLSACHNKSQTSVRLLDQQVDVAADKSATLEFNWTPEKLGEYHLKAIVDPFGRTAEIEKGNNQATVLVPVVKRDVYIASYGNPLEVSWCNVANGRVREIDELKRRGAIAAFCGMVDNKDESYRKQIKAGFNGVEVDEIGGYDQGTAKFLNWLSNLKTDYPDFFISLWMAGGVTKEMVDNPKIALFIGENYYHIGTDLSAFDVHIKRAREMGYLDRFIFGLGSSVEEAGRMGHTHTVNEQLAFMEKEMRYIAESAPEMPGIGLYGSRPGLSKLVDQLCYKYFVEPQFKEER
jgi:hypothetical protein